MRGPKYRLSPNEVERLVREERERRRKLRILQVREQAKANAASIRNDVRRVKDKLLQNMATEIKEQLEAEKEEKLKQLEHRYENTLHSIGEGHKEAHIHEDIENRDEKLKKQREEELAAQDRFRQALDLKKRLDAEKEWEQNKHVLARKAALGVEKERASQIASLPPPPPDISVVLEKAKKKPIPMMDMKAYATTHFHIPDYHVVKAGPEEQDMYNAKKSAEETDVKLKQDLQALKRSKHEQIEKARIRGNEALQKEMLKHDLGAMLKDLSLLQKKDRRRRQGIVSDLPKQVFVPPEKCLEERQERQKEMESKFDQLYLQHCKVDVEDLHSMSISEYLTTTDSIEDTVALDATPDISIPMSRINPALRDLTNVAKQAEPTQLKKPETVLRQLLNRIKEQRDDSKLITVAKDAGVPHSAAASSAPQTEDKVVAESEGQGVSSKHGPVQHITSSSDEQAVDVHGTDKTEQKGNVCEEKALADPDKIAISNNNKMIEDLLKRIQTIEEQKQQLAQQFQAHNGFYNKLVSDDIVSLDQTDYSSLMEVDIKSGEKVAEAPQSKLSDSCLPEKKLAKGEVFLKDVHNFSGQGMAKRSQPNQNFVDSKLFNDDPWYKAGTLSDEDLDKKFILHENRVTFDHNPSYRYYDQALTREGLDSRFTNVKVPQRLAVTSVGMTGVCWSQAGDAESVTRKLMDYKEKVKEKQAVMDEETTRRVREYQHKLFETHEERKKLLAEVRADIEKRRQELKLDVPSVSNEDMSKSSSSFNQLPPTYSEARGKAWEPIKPFIAEPRHKLATSQVSDDRFSQWLYNSGQRSIPAQLNKDEKKSEDAAGMKSDKIRRSLTFPEGDDSLSITWNDTPASKCSQDLSNNSRLYSSEEDHGSPILSDKSRQSDNKSFSSVLVARAAESRKEFQLRQGELQSQLLEIQKQKDAIQEKYNAGQMVLQQQQLALKSKLAQSTVGSKEEMGTGPAVLKAKPGQVSEPVLHRSWETFSSYGEDLSPIDITGTYYAVSRPDSVGFNGSRLSNTTSGRHSLGTPGNLSADSYLADISFQKIKSADLKGLPTSAFISRDSIQFTNMPKPIPVLGTSQPTWASLLKSSSATNNQAYQQSSMQDFTQQTAAPSIQQSLSGFSSFSRSTLVMNPTDRSANFESIQDVMKNLDSKLSVQPSPVLSDHQPHELSTILEVDTPLSVPGKQSAKRQATAMSNSQSSSISGSKSIQFFSLEPDFKVDIFKESYTLPANSNPNSGLQGTVFTLSRPRSNLQINEPTSNQGLITDIGDQILVGSKLGAKRTLNFSEDPNLLPRLNMSDVAEEEDLSLTTMPPLVNLTPIKPLSQDISVSFQNESLSNLADTTPLSNDRTTSLNITGFSDYLKSTAGEEGSTVSRILSNQSFQEMPNSSGQETKNDDSTNPKDTSSHDDLMISETLKQAQEFDTMLMLRLQQQSRAVFDNSTNTTASISGISDGLTASITAELEEITISEPATTDAEVNQ
ncbi:hypothetical protein Bpfe_022228 [Biomphalaria pfeifferi]|uniref:Uncharacterized protein n=1 Tax=Biomphalaria pfeifferi TaxID=112525 RepID=A0AAD8B5A5_BIOPF|nr:hypothetical protein Bpfe_022228 [Biomphalaria pfeifferi]